MADAETREILQRLATLQRDVTELLSLTKQGEESTSRGSQDAAADEEFFDAEGGE